MPKLSRIAAGARQSGKGRAGALAFDAMADETFAVDDLQRASVVACLSPQCHELNQDAQEDRACQTSLGREQGCCHRVRVARRLHRAGTAGVLVPGMDWSSKRVGL